MFWSSPISPPPPPGGIDDNTQKRTANTISTSKHDTMAAPEMPIQSPPLTPNLCFNEFALRSFLRTSRSTLDDSINPHLNSLRAPSPFRPPSSTRSSSSISTPLTPTLCTHFKDAILFPTWHARSTLLTYCTALSLAPDPMDPSITRRAMESAKASARTVDERLDPYSGRFFPEEEARTEKLARVLREEEGVERIVRRRTWEVVAQRCGGRSGTDGNGDEDREWEAAMEDWRRRTRPRG